MEPEFPPTMVRLADAVNLALDLALYWLEGQRAAVMVLDTKTGQLVTWFSRGLCPAAVGSVCHLGEGLPGYAALHGKAQFGSTLTGEPGHDESALPSACLWTLAVPIILGNRTIGVIEIDSETGTKINSRDKLGKINQFAEQIGRLILEVVDGESGPAMEENRLKILSILTQELNFTRGKLEVLDVIMQGLKVLWPQAQVGKMFLYDDLGKQLILQASFGTDIPHDVQGRQIWSWIREHYPRVNDLPAILSTEMQADPRFRGVVPNKHVCSIIIAPLKIQGELFGLLTIGSFQPGAFSERDLLVLTIAASQVAVIYQSAVSYSNLKSYADDILASVPSGVISTDLHGRVTTFNRAAAQILGQNVQSVIGQRYQSLFVSDNKGVVDELVRQFLQKKEPLQRVECQLTKSDGQKQFLDVSICTLTSPSGLDIGYTAVFDDITQKRNLEQFYRQAERLAAAGRLAAGAAHEIRNPLTSIRGFIQLIQNALPSNDPCWEYARIVISEADRIDEIIKELLILARPHTPKAKDFDLHRVLDETSVLAGSQALLHGVVLTKTYDANVPVMYGDPEQLKQVFLNLTLNSIQAMPNGGKLDITTRFQTSESFVVIEFRDSGYGIEAKDLPKIFDPFFTGKGEGTGLGLSVVRRIVESHGGSVRVDSVVERGTAFWIMLPVKGRDVASFDILFECQKKEL